MRWRCGRTEANIIFFQTGFQALLILWIAQAYAKRLFDFGIADTPPATGIKAQRHGG
jgi:hypothetical protein